MRLMVLISVLCCACQAKIRVSSAEVVEVLGLETDSVGAPALSETLTQQLQRQGFVLVAKSERRPNDFKIRATVWGTHADAEQRVELVAASLSVQPVDSAAGSGFSVDAVERPPSLAGEAVILQSVHGALEKAVRIAKQAILSDKADDLTLSKQLEASDIIRADAALVVLVKRKSPRALEVLLKRMTTDSPLTLRRTIGMLVELGDVRAVNALVSASTRKEPVLQRELLFAIGSLGGDDAEAYLGLVASGHEDPLLRASAEQALSDLRERLKRKAP
jgi:hypothetical protein